LARAQLIAPGRAEHIYATFKEENTIKGSLDVWEINWKSAAALDYFEPSVFRTCKILITTIMHTSTLFITILFFLLSSSFAQNSTKLTVHPVKPTTQVSSINSSIGPKPTEKVYPDDPPAEPLSSNDVILRPDSNVSAQVILRGWEGCDKEDPCNPDLNKCNITQSALEEMQKMIPNTFDDLDADPNDPREKNNIIDWNCASAIEFWDSFEKTEDFRQLVQSNMNTISY
jgi:hypothetical protein